MGIAFFGKIFISLKQQSDQVIRQKILIVDDGRCSLQSIFSAVTTVNNSFTSPDIWLIASIQRAAQLRTLYPEIKYILLDKKSWPGKYWIAARMFSVRNENFNFVILFSLDISPLTVSALFMNSKTMLHNQWGEWWHLGLRNVSQTFNFEYMKRSNELNLKGLIKRIGLFFIFPQKQRSDFLACSVLLIDNGYASFEHIKAAIHEIKTKLPKSRISILSSRKALASKYEIFNIGFFSLLKNIKYDYVFLLSLEAVPIFLIFLCMRTRIILFNQWRQWWMLQARSLRSFITPFLFYILNFFVFIYLVFYAFFVLMKKMFNGLRA